MADALQICKTALEANQEMINIAAQNAANAQSIAYKERMLMTTDNFYTNLKRSGLADATTGFASPTTVQRGNGTRLTGVIKVMTQGQKKDTGDPLNFYINGGGYFAVQMPGGKVAYTRIGAFKLTKDRNIVTLDQGYPLASGASIPAGIKLSDVNVADNGVMTDKDGNNIGQLKLSTFANELALEDIGGGLALETEGSGPPTEADPGTDSTVGTVMQGGLELSNVSTIEALTSAISAQRAYEMAIKLASAQSDMMLKTNDLLK